ncbi:hypothetical protein HS125_06455 [bacterium]|nr:hypothetical protein [bacterium]
MSRRRTLLAFVLLGALAAEAALLWMQASRAQPPDWEPWFAAGEARAAADSGLAAALALVAAHPELLARPDAAEGPVLVYEPADDDPWEGALWPDLRREMPPVACGSYFFAVFLERPGRLRIEALGRTVGPDGQPVEIIKQQL